MTRLSRAVLGAAMPMLTAACTRDAQVAARTTSSPDSVAAAPRILAIALVDSVPYENEMTSGHLRRVLVRSTAGLDTFDGVLVDAAPEVVGDTAVHGIRAEEESAAGLFAYDVRTRTARSLPTPPEWYVAAAPQLAPGGGHVAYLARDREGIGYAAVAELPSGRLVYRGPPATLLETDAGVDRIEWSDGAHFEIRIDLTYLTGGTQRVRGMVNPVAVTVDTLQPAGGASPARAPDAASQPERHP